jgi:hypothetical protein
MSKILYLLTCLPEAGGGKETKVHIGNLDDVLYKFGAKNFNPLKGFTYKRIRYVYKFYVWTGSNWSEVSDPRPEV